MVRYVFPPCRRPRSRSRVDIERSNHKLTFLEDDDKHEEEDEFVVILIIGLVVVLVLVLGSLLGNFVTNDCFR